MSIEYNKLNYAIVRINSDNSVNELNFATRQFGSFTLLK